MNKKGLPQAQSGRLTRGHLHRRDNRRWTAAGSLQTYSCKINALFIPRLCHVRHGRGLFISNTSEYMKYLLLLAMISPMCAFAQARFSRLYDYNDNDSQTGFTILEQSAQGYLVGMKNTGAEYSDNKILLFRLDELGNELWIKEIYTEGFIYYLDYGSMLRLPDGNYLLGGYIKELSTDLRDAFLIRTDTFGNVLWEKTYGVSDKNDFFGNFALTPDSTHIVFCGQTRRTDAAGNIWLVKTDLDGEVVWDKEIPQAGWQNGKYIAMLADGSFLLASHYDTADKNQYKVYKFDASGYAVWQKKVGTNHDDSGYPKVVALPDGSGLFTGSVGTADWRLRMQSNCPLRARLSGKKPTTQGFLLPLSQSLWCWRMARRC